MSGTTQASEASATRRPRSRKREEKNEATRLDILEAAGKIIGKFGYAGCSISRVAAGAKIAHGTFYLHFASQQEMFEQILPTLGARMLKVIAAAIADVQDIIELERRGFEANFAYLLKNPHMYRVLSEAELHAPEAFHTYQDSLAKAYARSLRRTQATSKVSNISDQEYESLATMLIGARTYLLMRYGVTNKRVTPMPPDKLETYLRFVSGGISGLGQKR